MGLGFLSNIELYYAPKEQIIGAELNLDGQEHSHITRVMRHVAGDRLFVTDGCGNIYKCNILEISKNSLRASIEDKLTYENKFENVWFCIPKLKSIDRFEFALEKCVELGLTNFIIFDARRGVSKGNKAERWNKILLSSMKQCIRSYLPKLEFSDSVNDIVKRDGVKIIFEQNSDKKFTEFSIDPGIKSCLIFGPEGGLEQSEINLVENNSRYFLTPNRLRAETAIIATASVLCIK
ncbi:MAG: RsmE family RNA methyltransferase [Ignavibacteria bacterium]